MGLGAVHPNGSNFRRFPARFNIVARMRRLIDQKLYDRPVWMDAAERAPPFDLSSMRVMEYRKRNPFVGLVRDLLKVYPNLRFQDCYVEGNDWAQDSYRDDHPIMQFVAHQLHLINSGIAKHQAFKRTEDKFREKRLELEKQQKIMMALAVDQHVAPVFTTGNAYWLTEIADSQCRHLVRIRNILRALRRRKMGPEGPALFPRTEQRKGEIRRRAFEEEAQRAGLASSDIDIYTKNLEEKIANTKPFKKQQNNIALPLDPMHLKNPSAHLDPFYQARHGLHIDEEEREQKEGDNTKEEIAAKNIGSPNEEASDEFDYFDESSASNDWTP